MPDFLSAVGIASVVSLPAAASNTHKLLVTGSKIWFSDGISWIDLSSSLAIITKREEQVSSAAQTVITLSTISYIPGTDNVSLYINGLNQAPSAFTETNGTTLTLSESITAGKVLDIRVNEIVQSIVSDNTNEVTLHFYRNN